MIHRLKTFIDYLHMSERAFALRCGIAQNTLNNYLKGLRQPSYEMVDKVLATFPDLSAEWLTRGKGTMLLSDDSDPLSSLNTKVDKILDLLTDK